MAVNSGAQVWTPFKELYNTVQHAIQHRQHDAIQDLEMALRRHRTEFIALLQNPAKNPVHGEAVKRGDQQGISMQGQQGLQFLTPQFIQEALIISNLFNLNEYAAVELLLAGENQQSYFPGLPRGLVAVLLYYDGRVSMVNSLRSLLQARQGRTWTLGLGDELVSIATKFTDQLLREGLVARILSLLKELDIQKELDKLQAEKALGTAKHRKQVLDLMTEIRTSLAECLFCLACQRPLSLEDTLHLLRHLRGNAGLTHDGKLDTCTLTLLMALMYCFDVRILDQEDAEEIIQKLPVVVDDAFVPDIHREVISDQRWTSAGLKATVQFVWGLTLRALSQYPSIQGLNEFCEQDEILIDMALKEDVFMFMKDAIVATENFHQEEFFLRQMHNTMADFVVQMQLKVKELRNRGDETARIILAHQQEGLEPPSGLPHDFEHMLLLYGDLYSKDPLGLELSLEYWCQLETVGGPGAGGFTMTYHYRPPHRQLSLHKFVRHAGDLLPPSLYVPYIKMLCGLAHGPQSAHHAFNLLKTNGMLAGGQVSSVSWEHFFNSLNQYYTSLRQEAPVTADYSSQATYRHHMRSITPQEVDGLSAVLKLMRTVVEQDPTARVALYENPQWVPVVLLLGLVSCPMPPGLKGELLLTLAAFARTPEIAANIWQSVEVAQILPTVPGSSVQTAGGLQVELDEIESRNEEFPLTRAFLTLMDALTDVSIPAGLGAGYRAPGFDPYLDFIRDSVFLNFNTRAYKNPGEKWQVACGALDLFHKLVWQYQLAPEDFFEQPLELQGGGTVLANNPPGHTLLVHLLNDSRLLKMILQLIHEASQQLDKYITFPGQASLEKVSLLCLKLVHAALARQTEFLALLRESGSGLLVTPMDRLLLSVNPATGRPDHIVNITKYMTYNVALPEHALYAIKILGYVSQSPLAIPELVGLFTSQKSVGREILHGFVECLEADDPEEASSMDEEPDSESSQSSIRSGTRQGIIQVLLGTIDQPAPNLAHFLLGYELRKPVKQTELQDPGVLGSPRTCLHSVLTLLDKGVGASGWPRCLQDTPQLASLAYQLIYVLCANKDTASPTMRYLRTAHDFLYRHLRCLPFQLTTKDSNQKNLVLSAQSWLLKSVAVELRLTSISRQRSHTQRLLSLLLEDSSIAQNKVLQNEGIYDPDYIPYDVDLSLYGNQSHMTSTLAGGIQCQRKLLQLLDAVSFHEPSLGNLELDFVKLSELEGLLRMCEQQSTQGATLCNVRMLHRLLLHELNSPQAMAASGQRTHMQQEVETICTHMVAGNSIRESVHVKRAALDGWRQVVEVMLTACPEDLLPGDTRHNVLLELLQQLLSKVAEDGAVPELTSAVSGVLLTLSCHLAHCFLETQADQAALQNVSAYTSMMEDTGSCMAQHGSMIQTPSSRRTLLSSSLQVVLKGLLEHILRSSGSSQRVMANLYGALLYYLQIAQKPQTQDILDTENDAEKGVGAMIMNRDTEYERLAQDNLSTICSYGENLMEVVCRYACDGHDVGRMLAFSTLNSILRLDKQGQWLSYMTSKGYVEHFVKSLHQDDTQLQAMLTPQPDPLRALYIYDAKMSLLTRIAQTPTGAQTLLQSGLMLRLAECVVFDLRPDIQVERAEEATFIPNVMQRYRQVLFPALKLAIAVLTAMGIENATASNQVLQFLIAHIDVVMTVLRDRHSSSHLAAIQELALMTALVSRAAIDDGEDGLVLGDTAGIEFRGHVSRLQRQMLALLPRYSFSQQLQKQIASLESAKPSGEAQPPGRDTQTQVQLAVGEVACNITAFCTHLLAKSATSAKYSRLLFNPSLVESVSRDLSAHEDVSSIGVATNRSPNLGVVVYMLRQCTMLFINAHDTHKQNLRKLDTLTTLSSEELNELSGVPSSQKLSSHKKHQLAHQRLVLHLHDQAHQLRQLAYIIENCLFLLWRHLDFYLVHCVPSDAGLSLFKSHSGASTPMRRLHDLSGQNFPMVDESLSKIDTELLGRVISRDELVQLKADTVNCINESLLKKLQEIDQCYMKGRSRYAFMGVLIRRLKRLLILNTGAAT